MQTLGSLVIELEQKIPEHTCQSDTISGGNVGWHIVHTCLVAGRIINALKKSEPAEYKWKYNWKRSYIFLTGRIPRGKIKAPAVVVPQEAISLEVIEKAIAGTKAALDELACMNAAHYFNHPFLGDLNVKRTKKFLVLHTKHHLRIINEIIRQHR